MERPTLKGIAGIFFRTGNLTFGSGNTTTALVRRQLVDEKGWLGQAQFALAFSIARVTPGTNLLAFVTGAGWYMRGWRGALAALLPISAPASIVTVIITLIYLFSRNNALGQAAFSAAMAAVVGIICGGAWLILRPHFHRRNYLRTALLLAGSTGASLGFSLPPVPIVLVAALIGYFWREPDAR